MCELVDFVGIRAELLARKTREAMIAGDRPRLVLYEGREYPVFGYTSYGHPIIAIDARQRALQPGEWRKAP